MVHSQGFMMRAWEHFSQLTGGTVLISAVLISAVLISAVLISAVLLSAVLISAVLPEDIHMFPCLR